MKTETRIKGAMPGQVERFPDVHSEDIKAICLDEVSQMLTNQFSAFCILQQMRIMLFYFSSRVSFSLEKAAQETAIVCALSDVVLELCTTPFFVSHLLCRLISLVITHVLIKAIYGQNDKRTSRQNVLAML